MEPQTLPAAVGPAPQGAPALCTTADACNILSVSKQTLHRMAARGDLKPVKVSIRCTRWRVADLAGLANR